MTWDPNRARAAVQLTPLLRVTYKTRLPRGYSINRLMAALRAIAPEDRAELWDVLREEVPEVAWIDGGDFGAARCRKPG